MDPVTLIVTALAAGAADAVKDGTAEAVKGAYGRLRTLVSRRFAGRPKAELVLAEHEAAPQTWQAPLAAELSAMGADADGDLVAAAQALMSLVDAAGSQSGKYTVTIEGSQGVQVGDRNTQTNTFGPGAG
jgi:microcompartment protein CcmL/EutN